MLLIFGLFEHKTKKNSVFLKNIIQILCHIIYIRIFALIKNINTKNKMKDLLNEIAAAYGAFAKDAAAQAENGNKAAGTRARKASLEIEKAMKAFRKASIAATK